MLRGLLAAAVICALASAHAQERDGKVIDRAGFEEAQRAMDGEEAFETAYRTCPADLFRTERPFWSYFVEDRSVDMAVCEADAMTCYLRCTGARSGAACFALARAFQESDGDGGPEYSQKLFGHSCAIGYRAGCTNRGAGIRNGDYESDPFREVDGEATDSCLFRSFEIACGQADAWGCAMLGQSYRLGEGVPADDAEASRHYRRSCEINPDFDACRFARRGLESIEGHDPFDGAAEN